MNNKQEKINLRLYYFAAFLIIVLDWITCVSIRYACPRPWQYSWVFCSLLAFLFFFLNCLLYSKIAPRVSRSRFLLIFAVSLILSFILFFEGLQLIYKIIKCL